MPASTRNGRAACRMPARRPAHPALPTRRSSAEERRARRKDAAAPAARRKSEALASTDIRHIVDPDEIALTHALAARLATSMRARIVRRERIKRRGRRLDLRRTIHRSVAHGGTPVDLALAAAQAEAAAPRRAARRVGLHEPLHRVLRALPAWRGRCLPRGGGVRLPHAAGACLADAARPQRHARGGEACADGARASAAARASARASPPSIAGTRRASSIRAPS